MAVSNARLALVRLGMVPRPDDKLVNPDGRVYTVLFPSDAWDAKDATVKVRWKEEIDCPLNGRSTVTCHGRFLWRELAAAGWRIERAP